MVDAVLPILIQKLLEGVLNEGYQVLEFYEQFKKMKKELPHMEAFLKDKDAERPKGQKETVKSIAREIRDLLYDAEDIIEDCELFLKQQQRRRSSKCTSYFSLALLKYRYQMGRRLCQINEEFVYLRDRMKAYLPTTQNGNYARSNQQVTYPLRMNDAQIVGLKDDVNKIKQWVMETCGPLRVIGITGMGRIGKTTLAQKIQNDSDVKESFEHILLVTISKTFSFQEGIKIMLRKLDKSIDLSNIDIQGLLEELHRKLDGTRYMVILDDMWRINENLWWESLKSSLPQSDNGCCVIVTTRNDLVVQSMGAAENHIHRRRILSKEESWSLFTKIAFATNGGQCPNSEIEDIGKEVLAKCGGLPLAIKVVGGVMLGKGHSVLEWRRISDHLKEELAGRAGSPW